MLQKPFKLKLIDHKFITPRVIQLTFIRVDGLPFHFLPGQFITFLLPNKEGKTVPRSYSLVNGPEKSHVVEIAVAPVSGGLATQILFNLKIGDSLECLGPRGRLILPEEGEPSRYILVATSTGVAPYRSMLSSLACKLEKIPYLQVVLLLGVSSVNELLYAEEFINFAQRYPRFTFRAYLSREKTLINPYCYIGYVCSAFQGLALHPLRDIVYLCGNPYMIEESKEILQAMGFTSQHIRIEKYFSAVGIGDGKEGRKTKSR